METILQIKDFNFKYSEKLILENLNLEVYKGEIVGLLGENGSGKTTFLNSVYGLNGYTNCIELLTTKPNIDNEFIKNNVSYIQDSPVLLDYFTARQYLNFICEIENIKFEIEEKNILELIKKFDLMDEYTEKLIKDYSFGMKKKIQIVSDFILHKRLIMIDEPTNGLDVRMILLLKKLIDEEHKNYGTTFIISSHNTNFLQDVCNRVFLFKNKKIARTIDIHKETNLEHEFMKVDDEYGK